MLRKPMIALLVTAAVSILAPDIAAARGGHGGWGGGGGWHGDGGGWHGGGYRAAAIGGGVGYRPAGVAYPSAAIGGGSGWRPGGAAYRTAAISAGAGFAAGHFAGRFHHGFHHHRRVFFVGTGPYAYYDDYYPYDGYPAYTDDGSYYVGDSGCYIVQQRVLTRRGWRLRSVQVCG